MYHCITLQMYNFITLQMHHFVTLQIYHLLTLQMYHCITLQMYYSITLKMYHCITLYRTYITVLFRLYTYSYQVSNVLYAFVRKTVVSEIQTCNKRAFSKPSMKNQRIFVDKPWRIWCDQLIVASQIER